MRSIVIASSLVLTTILAPAAAIAGGASTVRIETRPFYGASVTVEHGVRVFRPLPPHRMVIINPQGRTPLNLTIEDRRTKTYHSFSGQRAEGHPAVSYVGTYGGPAGVRHVRRRRDAGSHGHPGHYPAPRPHHGHGHHGGKR